MWELVTHYGILAPCFFFGWWYGWKGVNRRWKKWNGVRPYIREALLLLMVLGIFECGKLVQANDLHEQRIQEDRQRIDFDVKAAAEHRAAIPVSDVAGHLAVVGAEIAQISTRTFDLIQDSAPDIPIRTLAVFLDTGNGNVENLLQEGEIGMGRSELPRQSLVGETIKTGKPRYCRDVVKLKGDCDPIAEPSHGVQRKFVSLACKPLSQSTETFAAVCVDSREPDAFDGKLDNMWREIEPQLQSLASALRDLRTLRPKAKGLKN